MSVPPLTDAERLVVEQNLGLVRFAVNRMHLPDHAVDDAHQDGLTGLMRAAQKFDPALGFRFSTYAMAWIRRRISDGSTANFRRAKRAGEQHRNPLHLEAPMPDSDGLTIGETLAAVDTPDRTAADQLDLQRLARRMRAVCRDDIDRVLVDELLRGALLGEMHTVLTAAADRTGLTREAMRRRREIMFTRLRHPTARKAAA